jgi:hypothetical protein
MLHQNAPFCFLISSMCLHVIAPLIEQAHDRDQRDRHGLVKSSVPAAARIVPGSRRSAST